MGMKRKYDHYWCFLSLPMDAEIPCPLSILNSSAVDERSCLS